MTSAVSASFFKSPAVVGALVIAAGLAAGLLTPQILNAVDSWFAPHGFTTSRGPVYAVGGIPFALLIGAIARLAARADWWRSIAFGLATMAIMAIAITMAANLAEVIANWPEPARDLLAGPGGGLVGAALMAVAAMLLGIGPRRGLHWLPLVVVGTVLGAALVFDAWRDSENLWVVFPAWQAGTALVVLRTLQTDKRQNDAR